VRRRCERACGPGSAGRTPAHRRRLRRWRDIACWVRRTSKNDSAEVRTKKEQLPPAGFAQTAGVDAERTAGVDVKLPFAIRADHDFRLFLAGKPHETAGVPICPGPDTSPSQVRVRIAIRGHD